LLLCSQRTKNIWTLEVRHIHHSVSSPILHLMIILPFDNLKSPIDNVVKSNMNDIIIHPHYAVNWNWLMLTVATLQMNEAAATVVVWVIGSQTVQNWRQYRISRHRTLDGVTILLAMLLITKSQPCPTLCGVWEQRVQLQVGCYRKILLCLVIFPQKMPIGLLESVSYEADFTQANTFTIL
jgi:hypothetical protein